ncbi:hypothetical protein [Saccharomonospora xinjiangensis]|uniref:hypothetical protein n=1 Tax=Saccharomonospora xinjiangensis TaxID=75294 RepID=UPI001E57590F|nr:hypothetical protein [Saccharomonospora xinjiangensis]
MGARLSGTPVAGVLRLVRVTAVTATVVVLSAIAHLVGGAPVDASTLVAGSLIVLPSVFVVSRRRLSFRTLSLLLLSGQVVLHHVFTAAGRHHEAEAISLWSPGMAGAHLVATGITAMWLTRGERLLWAVWSWLSRAVAAAIRLPSPAGPASPPRPRGQRRGSRARRGLVSAASRRGPPWIVSFRAAVSG